jgi:hypothetical protein
MHVTIRGKRYELIFEKTPEEIVGYCDPPTKLNKRIVVSPHQTEAEILRVLIHEMLHAAHWDMCEEAIDESSVGVADVLWKLGYRRKADE